MSKLHDEFLQLTGKEPAPHQLKCAEHLSNGKSVILRAPTGSGKSEAVWLPFLVNRAKTLPARMIHVLPMRALANQLCNRAVACARKADLALTVAAMHGKRPETVLFWADAIFATLDQVVTSYACAPLMLGVRHGNIPAGAVAGSFLVFDEVHTFEPMLGLQSTLVLAERAASLGIPFVIMSATLPRAFLHAIANRLGLASQQIVEGERLPTPIDGPARRVELKLLNARLDPDHPESLLQILRNARKALIVANTVDRAIALFEMLATGCRDHHVMLVHSRFTDDDRQRKEEDIVKYFGRESPDVLAVLVATQVVEVGLDISCDTLISELAPVDALVQRAGRCARWGGAGRLFVFTDLDRPAPYRADLLDSTKHALLTHHVDSTELDWELEKILIDGVLDPVFEPLTDPGAAGRVLGKLAQAAFSGDRRCAEAAVRDSLTVEVAIHHNPAALGSAALRLPRCKVHPGVFANFLSSGAVAWEIVVDRRSVDFDDYLPKVEAIHAAGDISPGGFYVVHPAAADYNNKMGLRLSRPGKDQEPLPSGSGRERFENNLRRETWSEHVDEIVHRFESSVLAKEAYTFRALATSLRVSPDALYNVVRLVLILHDLGKLTGGWQSKIKQGLDDTALACSFLAHRGEGVRGLPPHATVSGWVATPCFERLVPPELRDQLLRPACAAITHHHSVRADLVPEFKMASGWFEVVSDRVTTYTTFDIRESDFNTTSPQGNGSARTEVNFLSPRAYTTYVLLSRWLRLADWIATGGSEDAILRYEKWFGGI
jgi:CRISPR-associated endonuclease/helicase Cas3